MLNLLKQGINTDTIVLLILQIIIVLFSLTVHEVAHGYAAYKLGDLTARNFGRLSLNPLKHLDPIGALSMLLLGFGWAKPVPINTRYFKHPKRDMAISALAGPLSNLLIAFVSYVAFSYTEYFSFAANHILSYDGAYYILTDTGNFLYLLILFFYLFFSLNITLAIFNLFPIPPLDGSRILFVILPDKLYFGVMKYERIIYYCLLFLLFTHILDTPIEYTRDFFENAFNLFTKFLPFL